MGRVVAPPPGAEKRRRCGANLLNRREDEAALRDAVALARPGQELGPAGRVYSAFRDTCDRGDPFRPERLATVAADLQAPLDPEKASDAHRRAPGDGRARAGRPRSPPPLPLRRRSRSSPPPSLWRSFAPTPRWRRPSTGRSPRLYSPASCLCAAARARDGGRRPGEAGWVKLVALAYARAALAALDLAQDLTAARAG